MADYYLIGIGGIGMSALAKLLLSRQDRVSGSDLIFNPTIEQLIAAGATIRRGNTNRTFSAGVKVIYSSDISPDNPELQAAKEQGCILMHRSELLNELAVPKYSLAVAGTHGKTTTSALLSAVLMEADYDPSFAIGGVVQQFKTNARAGHGPHFVFEADESDGTFLRYAPCGAILTNIDADHLVHYQGSLSLLTDAFGRFAAQLAPGGPLFWCRDDARLTALALPGQSYGFSPDADWRLSHVRQIGFHVVFDLEGEASAFHNVELSLVGAHNALNGAAVFAMGHYLGLSETQLRKGLSRFRGVMRRCEKKGEVNAILFLDDYAHHPTEIAVTLAGIRRAVGARRLIAFFQPHRYSRTRDCLKMFGEVFNAADEVIITDIYGAGETPIAGLSHENVLQEIASASAVSCQYVPRSAASRFLQQFACPGDVVVTLGAGDVTQVAGETLLRFSNRENTFSLA